MVGDIHTVGYNSLNASSSDKKQVVIQIDEHIDAAGNTIHDPIMLVLPEDSISNKDFLDWTLAEQSSDSSTDADFASLLYERSQKAR